MGKIIIFKLPARSPMIKQTAVVGAATFVGSGATTITNHQWVITGIGDLINTMITGAIAVGIILIIGDC
jgi:uncharacterized membrane protein